MSIIFNKVKIKNFLSGPHGMKYTPEGDQFSNTLKNAIGRQPFVDQSENYLATATKPESLTAMAISLTSSGEPKQDDIDGLAHQSREERPSDL